MQTDTVQLHGCALHLKRPIRVQYTPVFFLTVTLMKVHPQLILMLHIVHTDCAIKPAVWGIHPVQRHPGHINLSQNSDSNPTQVLIRFLPPPKHIERSIKASSFSRRQTKGNVAAKKTKTKQKNNRYTKWNLHNMRLLQQCVWGIKEVQHAEGGKWTQRFNLAVANAWAEREGKRGRVWERERERPRLPLTAHWMWWIAHPCPVMCMHIWCWNGLSTGPLSFNHVKAKYRTEHIFCCLPLLLCHTLQHNPHRLLPPSSFFWGGGWIRTPSHPFLLMYRR